VSLISTVTAWAISNTAAGDWAIAASTMQVIAAVVANRNGVIFTSDDLIRERGKEYLSGAIAIV
jgi:hypothetical protein